MKKTMGSERGKERKGERKDNNGDKKREGGNVKINVETEGIIVGKLGWERINGDI